MMRGSLISALLILAACDPVTVPERSTGEVYDFRLVAGADSVVMRWPNGSRIRVFVQPTDSARDSLLVDSVERGMVTWQIASLFGNYRLERASTPENADVLVGWSDTQLPVDVAQCAPAGARAFTPFCLTGSEKRLAPFPLRNGVESQVRYLITIRAGVTANAAAVQQLVAIELGHDIGCSQHSHNTAQINDISSHRP